jgi:hypothetical protein
MLDLTLAVQEDYCIVMETRWNGKRRSYRFQTNSWQHWLQNVFQLLRSLVQRGVRGGDDGALRRLLVWKYGYGNMDDSPHIVIFNHVQSKPRWMRGYHITSVYTQKCTIANTRHNGNSVRRYFLSIKRIGLFYNTAICKVMQTNDICPVMLQTERNVSYYTT